MVGPAAVLFLLNAALVAPLFVTERTRFQASIEGAFIGLARFLSRHPDPLGWYPYWYCGTPVQFTYTPGLHYLNALVMRLLPDLSAGQVYHAVAAVLYALGASAVAVMVYGFTRARWWALGAGLLWTLWSPAQWLISDVGRESLSMAAPWRLQALVKWGEGPHTGSLLLLPLVVVALWKASRERRFVWVLAAAALMAGVVLVSWVGAFALGVVALCFLLTPGWFSVHALKAGALAWLLAAFWITPGFVRAVAFNAQTVSGHYEYRPGMLGLLAGALAGLAAIRWLLRRAPPYLTFLALSSFFFGYLTLAAYWFSLYMIPQPHRYVPEFELFLMLLVCEALRLIPRRRLALSLALVLAVATLVQARRYLVGSHRMLEPARVAEWPEYRLARWLGANVAEGARVYIIGSEGMSLNQWVDVGQAKGWFDPGVREQKLLDLTSQISSSQNTPPGRDGAIAIDLLKTLGTRYVVVHLPGGRLAYQDFPRPGKFEGLLPAVYRLDSDAVVYEVPGARTAHLVNPEELPWKPPDTALDFDPLRGFLAAAADPTRPEVDTRWLSPNDLEVRGEFPPGRLLSLRVSHAEGWRAWQGAVRIPVERDHLGFLVVRPGPDPEGRVRLRYVGSLEQRVCAWISLVTLAASLAGCFPSGRAGRNSIFGHRGTETQRRRRKFFSAPLCLCGKIPRTVSY